LSRLGDVDESERASVAVEGGRRLTTYQAKGWYPVAVVFIETTPGVYIDDKNSARVNVAWKGRIVSVVDVV
jgi:hypothetical protein